MLLIIFVCIVSYLVGALPFGLWIGLLWKRVDIRTLGSKNIGATNVLRVLGPGPGITVFVLDTLKGSVGVWLSMALLPDSSPFWLRMLIGLLAILGHTFSVFLRFKGGKGVATSFGALLALSHWVGLVTFVVWVLFVAISRYVSLASLAAAWSIPFSPYFTMPASDRWWMSGLGVLLAILVTIKHRANIQRLLNGTESKIGQRVSSTPSMEVPQDVK